jgi:hypothetical protein
LEVNEKAIKMKLELKERELPGGKHKNKISLPLIEKDLLTIPSYNVYDNKSPLYKPSIVSSNNSRNLNQIRLEGEMHRSVELP